MHDLAVNMIHVALRLGVGLEKSRTFLAAVSELLLVTLKQVGSDGLKPLLSKEGEPIEVIIIDVEGLGRGASAIVSLSSTGFVQNSVGKCDLLKLFFRIISICVLRFICEKC